MSKAPKDPIKADELAALTAATSICCADANAAFVAKKRDRQHPMRSSPEGKDVIACTHAVRDALKADAGGCAEAYKKHLECVQYVGWRDSVKDCKETRNMLGDCALRAGLGELKDMM